MRFFGGEHPILETVEAQGIGGENTDPPNMMPREAGQKVGFRPGDRVRVTNNSNVISYRPGTTESLKVGDEVIIENIYGNIKTHKRGPSFSYVVSPGLNDYIAFSCVELVCRLQPGDEVEVINNFVNAHTPDGTSKDFLKPGDTVQVLRTSLNSLGACVEYKTKFNRTNYIPIRDVKKVETPKLIKCTCPTLTLMSQGCICGAMESERNA